MKDENKGNICDNHWIWECVFRQYGRYFFQKHYDKLRSIDGWPTQGKSYIFVALTVAIDKSTDIKDITQLAIFIRAVNAYLTLTGEFVQLVPMTRMTKAENIFGSLVVALDNVGVDWAHALSVAIDGAPSMTEKKDGVVAKLKGKGHTANLCVGFRTFHCIIQAISQERT